MLPLLENEKLMYAYDAATIGGNFILGGVRIFMLEPQGDGVTRFSMHEEFAASLKKRAESAK
jgi:hypothetical protein